MELRRNVPYSSKELVGSYIAKCKRYLRRIWCMVRSDRGSESEGAIRAQHL